VGILTVFGICLCKDEADVIATTVGHMLTQVDEIVVQDNMSTDGTREILEKMPVILLDDPEVAYLQSSKMSALAALAAEKGAMRVVPFDADEIWYSPFGRIADVLMDLSAFVATARLYDHVATADDPPGDPVRSMGWRRKEPLSLPKIACRPRLDGLSVKILQGNHGVDYGGMALQVEGQLVVRHFPYRSPEQFQRKARNGAAAYAATDLPEDVGAHWRGYGRILDEQGPEALAEVFRKWFWSPDPKSDETLIYDPAPICGK
jgi:hypothetical protein